jgi:hypothetical protein
VAGTDAASLGDGDHVQGVSRFTVAAAVEADLGGGGSGQDGHWCGADEPGEGVLVAGAVRAGSLADAHRRRQHSAAGYRRRGRCLCRDQSLEFLFNGFELGAQFAIPAISVRARRATTPSSVSRKSWTRARVCSDAASGSALDRQVGLELVQVAA